MTKGTAVACRFRSPLFVLLLLTAGSTVLAAGDAAPADVPADWWAGVRKQIADAEYEVTWQSQTPLADLESSWQAPNRAHGFRTYFTEDGIRVIPRGAGATDEAPGGTVSWEWSLRLARWGRAGGPARALEPPRLHVDSNRVEYRYGDLVESYVNDRRGLEHGFEIAKAPGPQDRVAGSESLVRLDLALGGTLQPLVSADGQAIDFATPGGAKVVHYAELHVEDALGNVLRSWMEGFSEAGLRGVRIVYDDAGAAYPVTVDPLATSPAWTAEGDQVAARFGTSVATAGDVNGDGYSDVVIGAYNYDNGQADEGRAFVYHGSAAGLSASPVWTAESDQANAGFGFSVATGGDVNGDGYADVIVGAASYDNGQADEGRAFVYHGSAAGLSATPTWTAESDQPSAFFGFSAATAGDVNGDGYTDVVVGGPIYSNDEVVEGRAFVYHGSAAGLAASPAWTAEGNQASAQFGGSVATAGDVNGDGYSDLIVGAFLYDNGQTDEGRAFVYHGSAAGLTAGPAWTAESDQANAHFGESAATAGDADGDGYSDVIVGAKDYDNGQTDEGRAFAYRGSAAGLLASPAWTAESDQANAKFGTSVATAGDVNGDGYADLIVGAGSYDNGEADEGRAFAYHGSPAGLAASPAWTAESNQTDAFLRQVATAGDVNGDGYADVIVGAPFYDNGQTDEGRAYVYHGSAAGLSASPGWTAERDQPGGNFGYSVATAGDVNGDGYSDVIVSAPFYDNGETDEGRAYVHHGSASGLAASPVWTVEGNQTSAHLGNSVATAGDVNGDGFSDVIVGSADYDNGETDEGRAYVYHGSAAGLLASPAWTVESNQANAYFGSPVATAGDVNGDGYSDIIVAAPYYDNGQTDEGRVHVYHGSASGLAISPAWTAESDQADARLGYPVATAGDVNGDGYSDVIVAAPAYDNGETDEGRAYVYHGSAAGLPASPAWTAEGNQTGALFGFSAATAGDVNGDGYADVIVPAQLYDNGQTDEGRAYVYHGSAAGLPASPAWTVESNQANALFGYSAATAGDVNGDGYADVIVGAYRYDNGQTDEGRAYVYHGSASGLASTAAWTAESDQADARYGWQVATAGDVNGDGYADVVVGAYAYENGQTDEGRAFVYYGNSGPGLTLNPRQRRATNADPIAHLGASDSPDSFRLNLLGRTPFGRGRVRLEQEVKRLGQSLNGSATVVGSESDTGTAGVALSELATGLRGGSPYHWRVRLRYDAATTPFAQHSRWLTMPWKGWQETMLRTASAAMNQGRIPTTMVMSKTTLPQLDTSPVILDWSASCTDAEDYGIYEGTLGAWYSHTQNDCSDGGTVLIEQVTPLAGSRYFLVVPHGTSAEGGYGTCTLVPAAIAAGCDAGTGERPVGASQCASPQVLGCP